MRKLINPVAASLAAALALGAVPAIAAQPADREAELAREVEGRVAGAPVDCIDLHRVRSTRIIDDTAIVYDAGSTVYVNRPRSGAESLDRWDTLLTRMRGTDRLCSIDTVELVDTSTRMMTGLVFLGDFVPYTRPRD